MDLLSFAKNMVKTMAKKLSKNLNNKRSQKLIDHSKLSVVDLFKHALKRPIQTTAEATVDLIGKEIEDKLQKLEEFHLKIIQKYLQIKNKILNLVEKYQKEDI